MFTWAQESWKITLNNKIILRASEEDEAANISKITLIEWKKAGYLELRYKDAELNSNLWHSFLFFDEQRNQLFSKDNTLIVKLSLASLRKLFAGKKEIKIYSMISSRDPGIFKKIRPVHLCTLQLP